jgi:hypothetical protein
MFFTSLASAKGLTTEGEIRSNTGFRFPDGSLQLTAAASTPVKMPVRCSMHINSSDTAVNKVFPCTTADGTDFVNVPPGEYFYVTDIIVSRRLNTQTFVAASVRIWEDDHSSSTGCSGGVVTGSYVTHQYVSWEDTHGTATHRAYRTPFLVLTPDDCLAVYTTNPSGLIIEASGYLNNELKVN